MSSCAAPSPTKSASYLHRRNLLCWTNRLDQGLSQLTGKDGEANRALQAGLKMVRATPMEALPGGLLPKSWKKKDGLCPERAVPTCWYTSSICRAVEHTLDHHGSAVHEQGMRIILFGAGTHDNLHGLRLRAEHEIC